MPDKEPEIIVMVLFEKKGNLKSRKNLKYQAFEKEIQGLNGDIKR